jgi:hypothetical protein
VSVECQKVLYNSSSRAGFRPDTFGFPIVVIILSSVLIQCTQIKPYLHLVGHIVEPVNSPGMTFEKPKMPIFALDSNIAGWSLLGTKSVDLRVFFIFIRTVGSVLLRHHY